MRTLEAVEECDLGADADGPFGVEDGQIGLVQLLATEEVHIGEEPSMLRSQGIGRQLLLGRNAPQEGVPCLCPADEVVERLDALQEEEGRRRVESLVGRGQGVGECGAGQRHVVLGAFELALPLGSRDLGVQPFGPGDDTLVFETPRLVEVRVKRIQDLLPDVPHPKSKAEAEVPTG